ncbi:hypothetical protein EON65_40820 [archaeon]|nr:MAG: hypothetical protein EON65_40820 [archaeon]
MRAPLALAGEDDRSHIKTSCWILLLEKVMDGLRLTDYLDRYDGATDKRGFSLSWIRILIKELRKGKVGLQFNYLFIYRLHC